jgi:hypothetical protein
MASEQSAALHAFESLTATLGRWLRGAWLYRWLMTEPEPEVIVIDLRETYTVGPIIALLDRTANWIGPRWRASPFIKRLARLTTSVARVANGSRTIAMLSRLFAPPPAENDDRRE